MLFPFLISFLGLISLTTAEVGKCVADGKVTLKPKKSTLDGVTIDTQVVDSETPVTMEFVVPGLHSIKDVDWELNGGPILVREDQSKHNYYTLDTTTGDTKVTLHLTRPKQKLIGDWLMLFKTSDDAEIRQTCVLNSPPLVYRFDETLRATEGYELQAVCKGASSPLPTSMKWSRADVNEETGDVTFTPVASAPEHVNVPGDTLLFKEVKKSDSGVYVCKGIGAGGEDSAIAIVKVKSKYAALWPFIGILAEMIVLLVTIIIYEKQKAAKKRKAAADADPLLGPNTTAVSASGDGAKSSSSSAAKHNPVA